jgi:hypothetical protein
MTDDQPDALITATPLALHEGNFAKVHADFQADPVVNLLKDATGNARASWGATYVGHRKTLADPLHTEDSNMQRSAKAAARRQDESLRGLDAACQRAARELQMIDEALSKPADPPAPHLVKLVADRLSSMSQEQRSKIISEALQNDDKVTINAVLFSAPAWTFGLSNAERDLYRVQYQRSAFPTAVARRAELEKAVDIATSAGQALIQAHGKLFDRKRLDEAAKLSQAAEAALGD